VKNLTILSNPDYAKPAAIPILERGNTMNTSENREDQEDQMATDNPTQETDFAPMVETAAVSRIAVLDPG
jgi:hypothetical protein